MKIKRQIEIGELFNLLNIKKPGEYLPPKSLKIKTPFGFKPVTGLLKTQKNPEWEVYTNKGKFGCFADYHRLETLNGKFDIKNKCFWTFVKNLKKNDLIKTEDGWETITSVKFNNKYSEMFDVEVDDVKCYYTNGFNSHNTLIMGNIALQSYLDGKNVIVYTMETSIERLLMRYYTNLTGLDKKEILSIMGDTIEESEELKNKIKYATSMTDGKLILKEYNANEACSNDLMAHINDLKMYEKFHPDIIIVDYLLLMRTNDLYMKKDSSYSYFKTITEELRNITKTHYVPLITACQINRGGMADMGGSKAILTGKDISESRGIYDTVDVFMTIIQTQNDKRKNKINVLIDKNRNDRSGVRIEYEIDYTHMKLTEGISHS